MIKIVICDDEEFFLKKLSDKITAYLEERELLFQITSFRSGEELLQNSKKEFYDFAFLDISMGAANGIDIAHRLKSINKNLCIVFVTGYIDYVLDGYKVGALRYLVKDSLDSSFSECMEAMLKKLHIDTAELCFCFNNTKTYLKAEEICFVESRGHRLLFVSAKDRSILGTVNGKLTETEKLLEEHGFLRIHQSFLVNMRYITKISGYRLELEQKITLPVPKSRYKYVKNEYAFYRGDCL